MKRHELNLSRRSRRAGRGSFLQAALLLALTCGSASVHAGEGAQSPEQAAARIKAVRTEIAVTRSNLALTIEQLHLIKGAPDPRTQFQTFTNQLAKMEERAQITRDLARKMEDRGDAYFADWEAQMSAIQDPDHRRFAQKTYDKRKESYDLIKMFLKKAGRDFPPVLETLKEVEHLLVGIRTSETITAAKDLFMRANWWCADVQRSLMQAELELDALAADLAGSNQ